VSAQSATGAKSVGEAPSAPKLTSISEARREMYRQQIIAAAEVEFGRSGFDGTKVSDIAATAGVSQATLYKHFAGKDAIWDALNQQRMEEFSIVGLAAAEGLTSPLESLLSMIRAQVAYFAAHPGFLQVHAREGLSWGSAGVDVGRGGQRDVWRTGIDTMVLLAEELVASGEVPKMRPTVLAGLVISSLQVYLTDWLNQGCVQPADAVSDELILHLRRSFSAS
jgi:AcrR family transcriptional regulator